MLRQQARRAAPGRAAHLDGSAHADRALALAPAGPWPETVAARDAVAGLMQSWDDAVAGKLFSGNVALDEPLSERRDKIRLIRERLGGIRDDGTRPPEFDTPAHCRWWVTGDRGAAQVEIRLSPERDPLVQSLILAVPPAAGSPLRLLLDQIIALMNDGTAAWPASVPAAPALDRTLLMRRLRAAAAWAGTCRAGAFRAGDGETSVTAELDGEFARLQLTVASTGPGDCSSRPTSRWESDGRQPPRCRRVDGYREEGGGGFTAVAWRAQAITKCEPEPLLVRVTG